MKEVIFLNKPNTKKRHRAEIDLEPDSELNASSVCDFTGLIPSAVKNDMEMESYEELYPTGFPQMDT